MKEYIKQHDGSFLEIDPNSDNPVDELVFSFRTFAQLISVIKDLILIFFNYKR
jgi:hypothetical protein